MNFQTLLLIINVLLSSVSIFILFKVSNILIYIIERFKQD